MTCSRASKLALAAAACLALTAVPSATIAVVRYDLSFGASVTSTDNLHLDAKSSDEGQREPVQEMVYAIVPGVRFDWHEGPDSLLARYRGEYWTFTGDEERDPEWTHELSANLDWQRWNPIFLEAEAERTRVPRAQENENEALIDQIDRTWFNLRTGYAWSLGTTGRAELAYRGEIVDYSGGGPDEDDQIVKHFGEGLVRRRWSPRWESELTVRYGQVERDLAPYATELRLGASADRRLSERLTARAGLEWLRETEDSWSGREVVYEDEASTWTNLLKTVEVTMELEQGGSWSLRYQDWVTTQSDGDTLKTERVSADVRLRSWRISQIDATVWHESRDYRWSGRDETAFGPVLSGRWVIVPWAALDLGVGWEKTTIQDPDADEIEDRTTRGGVAFVFLLGRHLQAEAGYVYRECDSTDADRAYTANLFSAALIYRLRAIPQGRIPASTIIELTATNAIFPEPR